MCGLVVIDQTWREACAALDDEQRGTIRGIALEVAAKYDTTIVFLRGGRRDWKTCAARSEAFWRCSNELGRTFGEIGRYFGNRDHSTVLHGIRRYEERVLRGVAV